MAQLSYGCETWMFNFCVQFIFIIQLSTCDDILIAKDGVEISYHVTRSDYCRTGENKIHLLFGINLSDCIIECALRNHCLALSYHHGIPSCLLLRSADTDDVIHEQCDFILKSDIIVHSTPCVDECSDGLACDLDTQSCKAKECLLPTPINGTVFGNRLTIGSKVRYKCDVGQTDMTGIYTGTCLEDGTWSHIANCEPIVIQNVWTEWSSWTPCDVTCDDGTQHRTRSCSTGEDCSGDTTEVASCNVEHCPPENVWTEWSAWTPCDVTCDDGTQHRTRSCSTGEDCSGDTAEFANCNVVTCPPENVWTEWSSWTPCDVTCDDGTQQRTRSCSTGDDCIGDTTEVANCNVVTCPVPTDCDAAFQSGHTTSGIYPIQLTTGQQMTVRCNMSPDTGGWTVIQRRISTSDFYKTWEEYKIGFGDLNDNFWFGNEKIWTLTQTGSWKLRIELTWNGDSGYAEYSSFAIGNEASNYGLSLGEYSGTIGDSLTPFHQGKQFTTKDRDNDLRENQAESNCAIKFVGAWWYRACHETNLNGVFGSAVYGKGLNWRTWTGYHQSVDTTVMKIQQLVQHEVPYV